MTEFILGQLEKNKKIIKFIIAGGTSAVVNFSLLYFLTELIGWWYLASSVSAFVISFLVSFGLQKFWTFQDSSRDIIYQQLATYLLIALCGLAFNAASMFLMVEYLKFWYMLAQFLTSGFIAVCNFMAYKAFVFNR